MISLTHKLSRAIVVAAAAILAGCDSSVPPAPSAPPTPSDSVAGATSSDSQQDPVINDKIDWEPHELSGDEMQMVKDKVLSILKDPDSAQFKDIAASIAEEENGIVEACGYVNAKSSYGGYTGFQPFSIVIHTEKDAETRPMMGSPTDGFMSEAIVSLCRLDKVNIGQ